MLHIKSLDEGLELFKTLGSGVRIDIIKILMKNSRMNMNELASELNITNGALTSHIKKLEDCGIVNITIESEGHGYEVYPTCGLASATALIGEVDDPRYFTHPDRYNADILWFTKGYVEYAIPNFIPSQQKIDQISISAELGSEAPGINEIWPSDVSFYLNDVFIGSWTSPGDFGETKGIFTPGWWYPNWNQYGMLKLLVINNKGTFIDGLQMSGVSIKDLNLTDRSAIRFRLAVNDDAEHVGGLTIYGKNFGNYNQNIDVKINYSPLAE